MTVAAAVVPPPRQLINHSAAAVCFDIPMHVHARLCVASLTDHLLLLLLLECRRQLINQSCCLFDIPTCTYTFWIFIDGRKILLVCVCVCARANFVRKMHKVYAIFL